MRKTYLLMLAIITIICIIVGSIEHLGGGFKLWNIGSIISVGDDELDEEDRLDMEDVVEFESFSNIQVETGVANLTIKKSDRNAVSTNISKKKLVPKVAVKDDTLIISQSSKFANNFKLADLGGNNRCDIVIEVDGDIDDLSIECGVGNLDIRHKDINNIDIELGVGDAELKVSDFENCDIEVGTGDVTMSDLSEQADYSMDMECGVGDITVGDSKVSHEYDAGDGEKNLDVEVGVGEIEVSFKGE